MVVLINNLGGTSNLEMGVITNTVVAAVRARGLVVERVYAGALMTSIAMAGFSLTIFVPAQLSSTLAMLDAPTDAPAWPFRAAAPPAADSTIAPAPAPPVAKSLAVSKPDLTTPTARAILAAAAAIQAAAATLNALDAACGDGDCGVSLAQGAAAVAAGLASGDIPLHRADLLLAGIARVGGTAAAGTSGAIYAILFSAAARGVGAVADPAAWVAALASGVDAVCEYGGAQRGDRTLLDALGPALDVCGALADGADFAATLRAAAEAAEQGARDTAAMRAHAGRASYVAPERATEPDAGATAVAIAVRAMVGVLSP